MRFAVVVVLAAALTGCAAGEPTPSSAPTTVSQPSRSPALPAAAVAYLRAWAANDVATMARNSAAESPARGFAQYWGDVFQAGRLDSGQADIVLRDNSATLTYADGSQYTVTRVRVSDEGLVTWSARPGGALAPRVVAGPVVSDRAGGVVAAGLRQYVNSEGGFRVSVRIRNRGIERRDVFAGGYVTPGGAERTATIGSGRSTGVIQVGPESSRMAIVAVDQARPGGRVVLAVVNAQGDPRGRISLLLPR